MCQPAKLNPVCSPWCSPSCQRCLFLFLDRRGASTFTDSNVLCLLALCCVTEREARPSHETAPQAPSPPKKRRGKRPGQEISKVSSLSEKRRGQRPSHETPRASNPPEKRRGQRLSHEMLQALSPLEKRGEANSRATRRRRRRVPLRKEARPKAEPRDAAGVESTRKCCLF